MNMAIWVASLFLVVLSFSRMIPFREEVKLPERMLVSAVSLAAMLAFPATLFAILVFFKVVL